MTIRTRAFMLIIAAIVHSMPPVAPAAQPAPATALERRELERDSVIQGVPCARVRRVPIEIYRASKRLAGCALSTSFTEAGHRFTRGTWLDRNETGMLWGAWLESNTVLDGHRCRGDGYKSWSTRFYPSGRLASCYLAQDTTIAGAPCMAGSFWREVRGGSRTTLYLYGDGQLKRCQASRSTQEGMRAVKRWDVITRDSITR